MSWEISREEELLAVRIWVREVRRKSKLDQADFGARYGVSERAVSQWENGHEVPCPRRLLCLFRDSGEEFRKFFDSVMGKLPASRTVAIVCYVSALAA